MSFGGHVQDMVNRMKENEALRKTHRAKYKKIKDAYINALGTREHQILSNCNVTKEELEKIKTKIRTDLKKERQKEIILTYSLTLIASVTLIYLFFFLFNKLKGVQIF
jgi:hypothetical protein